MAELLNGRSLTALDDFTFIVFTPKSVNNNNNGNGDCRCLVVYVGAQRKDFTTVTKGASRA